jgi:hypothetical protein
MLAQCLGTAALRAGFDVLFSRADVLAKGARAGTRRPHLRENVPPFPRIGPFDRG